ncbi:MAG TPA: two-component regulator propeller domain-containing protein [Vicinamibacterales bacterium]|nr:two-component regulator propeller domain-containing protein [Vicinamibacterales bacterium]
MLAACAAAPCNVAALDPSRPIDQYIHRAWTTADGLPVNAVHAIVRGQDGYLWLGTAEGLVRFDGLRFTVFNPANTPALADRFVASLKETPDGSLWIGTDRGGLTRLRRGQFTRYGAAQGLPAARVQAIADGPGDGICVGLRDAGLACLDGDHFARYGTRDGMPSDNVLALLRDQDGSLWVGTDAGLDRFRGGHFAHFSAENGLPPGRVHAIVRDHGGRLWIGTVDGPQGAPRPGGGVAVFEGGRFARESAGGRLPPAGVLSIAEDRDGSLWLGTAGSGVLRLVHEQVGQWMVAGAPDGEPVLAVAEDAEGSVWLGTGAAGLHRLRNNSFLAYTRRDGLPDDGVQAIFEDSRRTIWIGTHAGVCTLTAAPRCQPAAEGLVDRRVHAVLEDTDGSLWFGTEGGLDRLRAGRVTHLSSRDGLPVDDVRALARDRSGTLWVGTWGGGLARVVDDRAEPISDDNGTAGRFVNVLYQTRSGSIWVGTTEGLGVWTGDRLSDATRDRGMPASVESLYEDGEGTLWMGTRGGGLYAFAAGRLTRITAADGLADDVIGTILEDDGGNLWMGSRTGIFTVPRRQLAEFVSGRHAAVESRAFDTTDGMPSRECAFGQGRWKGSDGRLWFATSAGVVTVNPARVERSAVAPPVRIEEVRREGDALALDATSYLRASPRHLEFRFVGLSLADPARVRYRYHLDGYDAGWIAGGGSRTAQYTSLPPGSYRFRVQAANADGVWSADGDTFALTIEAPVWRRPWVLALLAVAGVLLLAGAGQRVAAVRQAMASSHGTPRAGRSRGAWVRVEAERRERVSARLASIRESAAAALASAPPADVRSAIEQIAEAAAQALDDVRPPGQAPLPEAVRAAGLFDALRALVDEVSRSSGIAFRIEIDPDAPPLPDALVEAVYGGVRELVHNVAAHAQATKARVTVEFTGRALVATVADNGRGFEPGEIAGLPGGLTDLAARAKVSRGSCRIRSAPGRGTAVVLELPVRGRGAGQGT